MNPDPIADALGAQENPAASDVFQLAVESADEVAEARAAARAKPERAAKIDELRNRILALPGGPSYTGSVRLAYRKMVELGLARDEYALAHDAVYDWASQWAREEALDNPDIQQKAETDCAYVAWGIVHDKDPDQPLVLLGVNRCPRCGSELERSPDRPRQYGCSECSFKWEAPQ